MNQFSREILVIDRNQSNLDSLGKILVRLGLNFRNALNLSEAEIFLVKNKYYTCIINFNSFKKEEVFLFLDKMNNSIESVPFWIMSVNFDPINAHNNQKTEFISNGILDVISIPFKMEEIEQTFRNIKEHSEVPLKEILDAVQSITGVQLGKEKILLVETRLMRRIRQLGLDDLEDYLLYFQKNRKTEINELVSLITTHTTEFFRENDHFKYLTKKVYPKISWNKKTVQILSAACSTGEEVFSLAINVFEYFHAQGIKGDQVPLFKVFGADVDIASITKAENGIYDKRAIEKIPREIADRYFDIGKGDLDGYVRVKDFVYNRCYFSKNNLMDKTYHFHAEFKKADIIFLRNVLIYFKPTDIEKVVNRLSLFLQSDGLFFLGHSESISNLKTPFKSVDNAIYCLTDGKALEEKPKIALKIESKKKSNTISTNSIPKNESIIKPQVPKFDTNTISSRLKNLLKEDRFLDKSLILIGASTGGTEAIRSVLELFPEKTPPILIVQHIPPVFSATFASRLNSCSKITVKEAENGEQLEMSHAYVAPGGRQMRLLERKGKIFIELTDDGPVNRHKPSVDYMFNSAVIFSRSYKIVASLLTGMGADGAKGLKELHDQGVHTIVQNEETCVVFGMPKAAIELGGASSVCALEEIPEQIFAALQATKK